jgi:hypothetical protein
MIGLLTLMGLLVAFILLVSRFDFLELMHSLLFVKSEMAMMTFPSFFLQ